VVAVDVRSRQPSGRPRNLAKCQGLLTALIEYYEPDARVFLFGFSRGAFTVRSLGGVLSLCGPQRDVAGNSPHDRQNKKGRLALVEEAVDKVYKHYGGGENHQPALPLFRGVVEGMTPEDEPA
jgi:hypothetical protein